MMVKGIYTVGGTFYSARRKRMAENEQAERTLRRQEAAKKTVEVLFQEVAKMIGDQLAMDEGDPKRKEITLDSTLDQLQMDSLDIVETVMKIEEENGIDLGKLEAKDIPDVRALVATVFNKIVESQRQATA
jgi:acyl carrier protein